MRAASTLSAIGAALWFSVTSAHALGFGRVSNATQLGQPLNFSAVVRLDTDESLARECVSAEVVSGENKLPSALVRVSLEGGTDSADRTVRVTTSTLIDEPVVTVSVTVGCNAKITRRFVAFIDPPIINAAQTAPSETPPPQRLDSQVAPIVTLVQGDNAAPQSLQAPSSPGPSSEPSAQVFRPVNRPPAPRPHVRIRVASSASAPGSGASAPRSPSPRRPAESRQAAGPRAAASGPRLRLEPAAVLAARSASAPAAASAPVASAAPVAPPAAPAPVLAASGVPKVDEAAELLVKERQRIQDLEDGLTKLRTDSQATQQSLAALQLRLKEAESERYANPLVYALAWLSALLALAVAGLWWRQSRSRASAQWWSGPAPVAPVARRVEAAEPVASAPLPLGATPTAADAFAVSSIMQDDEPMRPPGHGFRPTMPAPAPVSPPPPMHEPARELSVEELIDLEQQAEFFVVLGQDEAAIELLMSHVRSDGGISPLPYLKLLEIYRRRGDHEAYERIRERFNRRFNAYAPDWDSDLQHGRALVEYPGTIERLQGLWASPARVMETLDASLFRRNNTDETFDLPAYRELLFLYSIARDLAEHGGLQPGGDVDVLLPLGGDDDPDQPISRLMATAPGEFQHSDLMTVPLDLDVSFLPEGLPHDTQTMPSALHPKLEVPEETNSNFIDFDLSAPINPPKISPTKKR